MKPHTPPGGRPDLTDVPDTDTQKRILRRSFPGWSIIVTDRGRWWGTRPSLTSEDLSRHPGGTVDADTAGELYEKLDKIARPELP